MAIFDDSLSKITTLSLKITHPVPPPPPPPISEASHKTYLLDANLKSELVLIYSWDNLTFFWLILIVMYFNYRVTSRKNILNAVKKKNIFPVREQMYVGVL